ncbi:aldehyde dehydrogenase family protein [Leadbetterella sp. DM7]|uniref:aldehyde dehydrogenase family protein n=1 Tax=Leadbetterella sp. DM7 TaxID=3235085 RepID=UPI00349E7EA2
MVADTTGSINRIFEAQKAHQYKVAESSCVERKTKLLALKKAVEETFRQEIRDALFADFRKPQAETDLTEIFAVTSEINHTVSYLEKWMSDRYVKTPLSFFGSSSYVRYEPKGTCLIISPWNFPVNLSLGPLVSAVAAGNTAVIKPSEYTPHSSAVLRKIVAHVFSPDEVEVIEGGVETSTELLSLPFNHIFFTGSPQVGKVVMKAAAEHLASVTLELGGKSPVIIDETADIQAAARRLAWGKFMNSGQICIAPDYVFVHRSKAGSFLEELERVLADFYGQAPLGSDSYCSMVNEKHAGRVHAYLEDAVEKGAKVVFGGEKEAGRISPTVITEVAAGSKILQEEIFGPLLPVLTYDDPEEVVRHIRSGEKPLALYIYSRKNSRIEYFLSHTRAGGTCINNNDMHFLQPYLPFGGDNNSGIGKAHGEWGFKAFSNERSVYRQHLPSVLEKLMPPYTAGKNRVIEWIVKLF